MQKSSVGVPDAVGHGEEAIVVDGVGVGVVVAEVVDNPHDGANDDQHEEDAQPDLTTASYHDKYNNMMVNYNKMMVN